MILEIRKINKSFGAFHVLHDVSFAVQSNSTLGFLGRNGSGKTTTIRIIMEIIAADSGEILMDGVKLNRTGLKLGYLPEERGLYQKVAVLEQMIYFGKLKGLTRAGAKKAALRLLEQLEATEYLHREPITLSKGNQQKIQLAIALLHDPDLLILDEPFSGLDPVNAKVLRDVIEENARQAKTILFSSHQLGNVEEFCEDVCLIDRGRVALFGNLREIKDDYPKEKLLLVPEQEGNAKLKTMLDTDSRVKGLLSGYAPEKNGFLLYLRNPAAKDTLLQILTAAASGVPLRSFAVVEPSLLDIFLEKVGAAHEKD